MFSMCSLDVDRESCAAVGLRFLRGDEAFRRLGRRCRLFCRGVGLIRRALLFGDLLLGLLRIRRCRRRLSRRYLPVARGLLRGRGRSAGGRLFRLRSLRCGRRGFGLTRPFLLLRLAFRGGCGRRSVLRRLDERCACERSLACLRGGGVRPEQERGDCKRDCSDGRLASHSAYLATRKPTCWERPSYPSRYARRNSAMLAVRQWEPRST